jgi:hypothetical protein
MKIQDLGAVLFILGIIILGLSNIVGIGYGLYLWGALGNPFSTSAWISFVLWIKMILTGLLVFITGAVLGDQ